MNDQTRSFFPRSLDFRTKMNCQIETEWDLCVRHQQYDRVFCRGRKHLSAGNTMLERNERQVTGLQRLTRVVKERVQKSAIFEKGSNGWDIFKIAVEERWVDERDRFELHTDKPGWRRDGGGRERNRMNIHKKDQKNKLLQEEIYFDNKGIMAW